MNELALFAGAGGGILGGKLLGWRTVCAVEREPYAASVLAQRQNDGLLPAFPIWDDVCTFDGKPWRGVVDVVSGGFPCQDISAAGKGAGIDGERSGLWGQMARIVGEVRPRFVFVENSPLLVGRGLVRVLADLADLGFDAQWGVVGANDAGAPHQRDRLWIVAYGDGAQTYEQLREPGEHGYEQWGTVEAWKEAIRQEDWPTGNDDAARLAEILRKADLAEIRGVVDGVAGRVDRLKAIGNGQVPQCAAEAWRILTANAALTGATPNGGASG